MGGQGGRKIPRRYYFGEHLGLYEGSRPLGEPVLWPLAARCLPVCVEPFVMFLPDGGVVKRTERAEMSLLCFFLDFLVFGIQPRIRPICVRTILAFEPVCCDLLDANFLRSYEERTGRAEIST